MTGRPSWHVINLPGRQIGDVWTASTEAVALLRFLASEIKMKAELFPAEGEINLYPVGACHPEAQFFCVLADLVIIDGEPAVEDYLIQAM